MPKLLVMFRDRLTFHSDDSDIPASSNYGAKVRAAHELADLLKRNRPHLYEQVNELQATVVRCQQTLDQLSSQTQRIEAANRNYLFAPTPQTIPDEVKAALEELETTTQALLDLRHKGQMAR